MQVAAVPVLLCCLVQAGGQQAAVPGLEAWQAAIQAHAQVRSLGTSGPIEAWQVAIQAHAQVRSLCTSGPIEDWQEAIQANAQVSS